MTARTFPYVTSSNTGVSRSLTFSLFHPDCKYNYSVVGSQCTAFVTKRPKYMSDSPR